MKKFLAVCLFIYMFPSALFGAGSPLTQLNKIKSGKAEGPIKIRGATIEHIRKTNTFIGKGFVDVVYGDLHLQAEKITLDGNTGELVAEGSVILDDPGGRITGEKIFFNLKSKTGKIISAEAFMKPYYHFKGEEIEKVSEKHFIVKNGYYTPCSEADPHWHIRMEKADVYMEDYAHLHSFSFRIGDIPLFYFPYAVFPAKTKRASGLLRPHLGYSAWRGFEVTQPYYWNINPWSDATLSIDYKSNMGVGASGEYRYKYTKKDWGKFYGYLFQEIDKKLANNMGFEKQEDRKRWNLYSDVVQTLPWDIKTTSHLEKYSDKEFPQVFSDKIQDRKLREEDSYFFADKNTDTNSLSLTIRRIRDMQPGTTLILQKAPQLSWNHISSPIPKTPLYFRNEALYNFYIRDNKFESAPHDSDYRVHRFFINPEISLPISLPWGMTLNTKGAYMGTLYSRDMERNNPFERNIFRFDVDFMGPAIYSVFSPNSQTLEKIQHIIEPRISYHYVPHSKQSNLFSFVDSSDPNAQRISRIDNLDFIPQQNLINLSVRNFFNGRFRDAKTKKTTFKKIALLELGADLNFVDYDFDDYDLNETLQVIGRDSNAPYSYLYSNLELSILPYFEIATNTRFNLDKNRIEAFNADVLYDYGFLQANIHYRSTIDIASTAKTLTLIRDKNEFLTGNVTLRFSDHWSTTASTVWNLNSETALETRIGVNYTDQCWGANFIYIARQNNNNEFHLLFNLLTLGSIGI